MALKEIKVLTYTSYCILIRLQPLKLVGGSGGMYSISLFQWSVVPGSMRPFWRDASSLVSDWTILFLAVYWIVWNEKQCLVVACKFVTHKIMQYSVVQRQIENYGNIDTKLAAILVEVKFLSMHATRDAELFTTVCIVNIGLMYRQNSNYEMLFRYWINLKQSFLK